MKNGIFTISLDFELHWGVFDKRDRTQRKECYLNTIDLIPKLLDRFHKHGVHVTWATVGSLFVSDEQSWSNVIPAVLPKYADPIYSPYQYAQTNGIGEQNRWAHFAPGSVKLITEYPGQELGTHTFGHYYCLEPGNTLEAFTADLDAAIAVAAKMGQTIRSLVFPRNQFNKDVLSVCYQKGIETVRSNPDAWFWTPVADSGGGLMRKIFRTGDGYLPLTNTVYSIDKIKRESGEPLQLPASRLLRSWHPKYGFSNRLHLNRVIGELKAAAKSNQVYHLWWHPENFGDYPDQCLEMLDHILQAYTKMKQDYGMQSWNMGEYPSKLQA